MRFERKYLWKAVWIGVLTPLVLSPILSFHFIFRTQAGTELALAVPKGWAIWSANFISHIISYTKTLLFMESEAWYQLPSIQIPIEGVFYNWILVVITSILICRVFPFDKIAKIVFEKKNLFYGFIVLSFQAWQLWLWREFIPAHLEGELYEKYVIFIKTPILMFIIQYSSWLIMLFCLYRIQKKPTENLIKKTLYFIISMITVNWLGLFILLFILIISNGVILGPAVLFSDSNVVVEIKALSDPLKPLTRFILLKVTQYIYILLALFAYLITIAVVHGRVFRKFFDSHAQHNKGDVTF